ncbi:putative glycoside hydrolase [Candidatus Omnitrophota bacterium]
MNRKPRNLIATSLLLMVLSIVLLGDQIAIEAEQLPPVIPELPQCEGRSVCPFGVVFNRWEADEVEHYCQFPLLLINQRYQAANMDQCPDTQFYFYYPFHDRHFYPAPFYEQDYVESHPEWFLFDVGFEGDMIHRVYDTRWPHIFKMDVNNLEYREYMKDRYQRLFYEQVPGITGIFEDGDFGGHDWTLWGRHNLSCAEGHQPDGIDRCPPHYDTAESYNDFYNDAYNDLQTSLPDIPFISNSGYELDGLEAGAPIGETKEHTWHFHGRGADQFYGYNEWKRHVDWFGRPEHTGKITMAMSGSSQHEPGVPDEVWRNRMMEYSAGSFLLGLNPDASENLLYWHTVWWYSKPDYEDRIYSFDIGDPLGTHYILPNAANDDEECKPWHQKGVHTRDFSEGKVLVNPTPTCTYQIPLNRRYKDLDGQRVRGALTLTPNTAKILLNAGPTIRRRKSVTLDRERQNTRQFRK